MIAIVRKGKLSGEEVEVIRWRDDWFSANTSEGQKIYAPSSLVFTSEDFGEILKHENNGKLFEWFEGKVLYYERGYNKTHYITFKKRKSPYV